MRDDRRYDDRDRGRYDDVCRLLKYPCLPADFLLQRRYDDRRSSRVSFLDIPSNVC